MTIQEDDRSSGCDRFAYLGNESEDHLRTSRLEPSMHSAKTAILMAIQRLQPEGNVIPFPGPRPDPKDHERAEETNRMRQVLKTVGHPPAVAVTEALPS
jgi:hypothetical protein